MEIGRQDVPKFIRGNLRCFLTDEAALPYSWHGHRGNIAVCDFVSMETLIGKAIGFLYDQDIIFKCNFFQIAASNISINPTPLK